MVVSSRILLQLFQLPGKNLRDISRLSHNFLRYFRVVTYYFTISLGTLHNNVLWNPKFPQNPV